MNKKIKILLFYVMILSSCRNPLAPDSTAQEIFHPGIPSQITPIQMSVMGTQPGGLSISSSFSSPPSAGNAILIYTWAYSNVAAIGIPATSCTDNYGNSYRLAVTNSSISGANRLATSICYLTNISQVAGPVTVTISPTLATGTTQIQAIAIEYHGMALDPVDQTSIFAATSVNATSGTTGITTRNNELVVSIINSAAPVNPIIFTSLEGFSILAIQSNCIGRACGQVSSKTAPFVGPYVENWIVNAMGYYNSVIATFKPQ